MIADDADRATAETHRFRSPQERRQHQRGIDAGVEEQIEMIVRKRLAAFLRDERQPSRIAEKHQKHRRLHRPRHFR
jgi:hypothetical protein